MRAQGVLSWVGQAVPGREPPRFEARLYDKLFKTSSVAETGDDWLEDLNPQSLTTVEGALATPRLAAAKAGDKCAPRLSLHCAQEPQYMEPCYILHARECEHCHLMLSAYFQCHRCGATLAGARKHVGCNSPLLSVIWPESWVICS